MINNTTKKKNKLNTYKAVRENIHLNNQTKTLLDLSKSFINDSHLMHEFTEFNLQDRLDFLKNNKKETFLIRWWEN